MAIVAFTDITSIVLVVVVVLILDVLGYITKVGVFYIAGGVLGLYTTGWTFNNGSVIAQTAYNATTGTFVNNKVDANLIVAVLAIITVMSFFFIYFEKNIQ